MRALLTSTCLVQNACSNIESKLSGKLRDKINKDKIGQISASQSKRKRPPRPKPALARCEAIPGCGGGVGLDTNDAGLPVRPASFVFLLAALLQLKLAGIACW